MHYSVYQPTQPLKPKRRLKWPFLVLILVLLIGGGVVATLFWPDKRSAGTILNNITKKEPEIKGLSGKYLFSGTVVLDRRVASDAKGDYNQPFSRMSTLGTYDGGVAFFECPVTGSSYHSVPGQDNPRFNCSPEWLPALKTHFPIINLSSNHTYDMGADGFTETVRRLKEAGIQVVGNFNPHAEADNCKVVILPVKLQKKDKTEVAALPVAMCSFNYKYIYKPNPGELESIQNWSKLMPVFGLLNAGAEYQPVAGAEQTTYARKMIDYGAEFVIANGTHWVQNTEVYKGKLIVYSMGNFIFDQSDYPSRIHNNIALTMSLSYDDNIGRWLELGKTCQINSNDVCFKEAQTKKLTKIKPTYKFEAIGSYGGAGRVAERANAQQQSDIEARASWPQTKKELGQ